MAKTNAEKCKQYRDKKKVEEGEEVRGIHADKKHHEGIKKLVKDNYGKLYSERRVLIKSINGEEEYEKLQKESRSANEAICRR